MVTRLREGVWHVAGRASNIYLLEDGQDLFLVDAGTPGDAEAVRELLLVADYELVDITGVLLTHYDLDHVGSLSRLTPELDAPIFAHDPDAAILAGEESPPLSNHKGLLQWLTRPLLSRPDLPVKRLADGDTVGSFTAFHTPGHTPGHVAFVSADRDVAFLGDLVRESEGTLSPSPWIFSYDTEQVRSSITRLAGTAPAFDVACPGHGDPIRTGGSDALAALASTLVGD